ncbi:MAG: sigma-70 family RNA polymerase sigma factor [Oscillospiraceae bacterium]|nr:sigma-70 family RNA polymerase sigma factor [Oscillospiraceae bacterium]
MPDPGSSDNALVRAIQKGDQEALGQLIDRYNAYVTAIVWHIVQGKLDESDAKALVSDSFYALWRHAEAVRPGKLKAYLGRIARSKAINALRQAGRDPLPLEEDALELTLPGPEDALTRREELAALHRALDHLGEPDRSIFIRHYCYYQSAREIGQRMGINPNTIHTKLRRGREALRRELTEGGFSHETEHLGAL